jgi:hypothetical protein
VLEWRRLSLSLRSLQKLRGCARLHHLLGSHRVRARAKPHGTETGRVILSEPAMQQVPHEVSVRRSARVSIHSELEAGRLPPELHVQDAGAAAGAAERGVGIGVAVVRADMHLWLAENAANSEDLACCQLATLRAVLPSTIDQPFFLHGLPQPSPLTYEASAVPSTSTSEGQSLADYWRERGFEYSEEAAASIRQVVVQLHNGVYLSFPADKVILEMCSTTTTVLITLLTHSTNPGVPPCRGGGSGRGGGGGQGLRPGGGGVRLQAARGLPRGAGLRAGLGRLLADRAAHLGALQ